MMWVALFILASGVISLAVAHVLGRMSQDYPPECYGFAHLKGLREVERECTECSFRKTCYELSDRVE